MESSNIAARYLKSLRRFQHSIRRGQLASTFSMTRLVGNRISSLIIVVFMLLRVSADCPIPMLTSNETLIRFSAYYNNSLCDSYTPPNNVDVIVNAMIKKWNRSRTLNCYQNYEGGHFIVGHANCERVNRVEFHCVHNFTDNCPYLYLVGFTAWSKVETMIENVPDESCVQTRHTKSIPVYGVRPVMSFNINLRCDGHARCLHGTSYGVSVMYIMYKANEYDGSYPGLGNC